MFKSLTTAASPRSIVLLTVATMMLLSLFYSTAIKYGHADTPIATANSYRLQCPDAAT